MSNGYLLFAKVLSLRPWPSSPVFFEGDRIPPSSIALFSIMLYQNIQECCGLLQSRQKTSSMKFHLLHAEKKFTSLPREDVLHKS